MGGLPLPTEISDFVDTHTPEAKEVWHHFNELRQIPRGSKEEKGVRDYAIGIAQAHGLSHATDEAGNLVIYAPSNNGSETTACIQGHMDMVWAAEKGSTFDFTKDTIPLVLKDGWIAAQGTSAGFDCGLGISGALALITDPSIKHCNLEILLTVEEEIGCNGAQKLEIPLKAKYLLNVDSEDGSVIYNGCAGSITQTTRLTAPRNDVVTRRYILQVSDLEGGHSGIEIHEDSRGNAVVIAGKLLQKIESAYPHDAFRIIDVNGDKLQARNKIPHAAEVTFAVPPGLDVIAMIDPSVDELIQKYPTINIATTYERGTKEHRAFSPAVSRDIIGFMTAPQHGVYAWSQPGKTPHISSNLGVIRTLDDGIEAMNMVRSDNADSMEKRCNQIVALSQAYGFQGVPLTEMDRMEPWQPEDTPLARMTCDVAAAVYAPVVPTLMAVHAGLEADIIRRKHEGMQPISFGPWIKDAHKDGERVEGKSVGKYYQILTSMVGKL
jgi:dipeptidase D